MPPTGRNLTRVAARERAGLVEVSSYDITLDLTEDAATAATFRGTTTVSFRCTEPGSTVVIDVAAERLISATLNGVPMTADQWSPADGLELSPLGAQNELTAVGDFCYNTCARGTVRTPDP